MKWTNPEHPEWEPTEVWPIQGSQWGSDCIREYVEEFQADCVISLFDQWAFPGFQQLGSIWLPYTVCHYQPMEQALYDAVKDTWRQLCLCEWAKGVMEERGLHPTTVPLGVDTKVFRPLIGEMSENGQIIDKTWCRNYGKWAGMPKDRFIFGMVAANRDFRKNLEPQLRVFAEFVRSHPDAHLVMHTNPGPQEGGWDLPRLIKFLGIADNVDMTSGKLDLTSPELAILYNSFDCLLLASASEGFGIPIIEAEACGIPVITHDYAAMSELAVGWMPPHRRFVTPMYSYGAGVDENELYRAMEAAYGDNVSEYRDECREKALYYDWDAVVKRDWMPALAKWQEERPL
jgi:glycosyltransferase involved in cell wall biosynthesis